MTDDPLPPLREVIARHGLAAKKSLGQNFILDLNLTRRIARAAAPLDDGPVIEVGAGPGGLTRALLMEGAAEVIAIERDPRALPALAEIAAAFPGRLRAIETDATAVDWPALLAGRRAKIVANLPYNVATPLLVGWLTAPPWPPWWRSLTLMFQKEVAERICATPGSDAYGRLAVLAQWRASARKVLDVDRRAFTPAPNVTSAVVHIEPAAARGACRTATLERVTAAAFGQRRKMIRSSLKGLGGDTAALIAGAGLRDDRRAEEIDIAGFCRLAAMLEEMESACTPNR